MTTTDYSDDHNYLFTLNIPVSDGGVIVHAFEAGNMGPNHTKINVEVGFRATGSDQEKVIFARGDTWCGIPSIHSIDGAHARELVGNLIAMKPGDTDSEYFESYTSEQLEFAKRYGEEISLEIMATYCDENGNVIEDFDTETDPLEISTT